MQTHFYNDFNDPDLILKVLSNAFGIELKPRGKKYNGRTRDTREMWLTNQGNGNWRVQNYSVKHHSDIKGNAFNLAVKYKGNKADAIQYLLDLAGSENVSRKHVKPHPVETKVFIPNGGGKTNISATVKYDTWTSENGRILAHDFNRFGVTIETLKRFNVQPLKSVTWVKTGLPIQAKSLSYSIRIPNSPNEKIKLNGGKILSAANCGNYVFGLDNIPDQLPDKTKLFFVEGEKDCLVFNQHFNALGWYAITNGGVGAKIDNNWLQTVDKRLKDGIYTLYDNDTAGREATETKEQENGLKGIDFCSVVNNKAKFPKHRFDVNGINTVLNDIADIIEHQGAGFLKRIIDNETREGTKDNPLIIDTKLSDHFKNPDSLAAFNIVASTDLGKTFFAMNSFKKVILLTPTIAIAEQAAQYGAQCITEGIILYPKNLPDKIAVTYAGASKVHSILTAKQRREYHVFIDEIHLAGLAGYARKDINYIKDNFTTGYKDFTTLTGTDVFSCDPVLNAKPKIYVKYFKLAKPLTFVKAFDPVLAAAKQMIKVYKAGEKVQVLLNSKNEARELGRLKSYLPDNILKELLFFNADTKETPAHRQLIETGKIDPKYFGFVSTAVIKEGVNVYGFTGEDPQPINCIIIGNWHAADIEQFPNRFRKHPIKVFLIQKQKSGKWLNQKFDIKGRAEELTTSATECAAGLNNVKWSNDTPEAIAKITNALSDQNIRYHNGEFVPDLTAIDNQVLSEQAAAQNADIETMKDALSYYDFDFKGIETETGQATKEQKQNAKERRDQEKKRIETETAQAIEKIKDSTNIKQTVKKDSKVRANSIHKEICKDLNKAFSILPNMQGLNRLKDIAVVEFYEKNKDRSLTVFKNLTAKKQVKDNKTILAQFKHLDKHAAGGTWNAEQIRRIVHKCISLDPLSRLKDYKNAERITKHLEYLRQFFKIESVQKKRKGKRVYYYNIIEYDLSELYKL